MTDYNLCIDYLLATNAPQRRPLKSLDFVNITTWFLTLRAFTK